jgi:predicted transcriptional regulator
MTKLENWLSEHGLEPDAVAKGARVHPNSFMKSVTGESEPSRREMTQIVQAIRLLSADVVTVRDLFDLPPVDMNF